MLVNRRTFIINKPYFQEALDLLVEARKITKAMKPDAVLRVYASEYGAFDTVAYEYESASLATLEQELSSLFGNPETADLLAEWFKRWQEITAPGGANEIWLLAE